MSRIFFFSIYQSDFLLITLIKHFNRAKGKRRNSKWRDGRKGGIDGDRWPTLHISEFCPEFAHVFAYTVKTIFQLVAARLCWPTSLLGHSKKLESYDAVLNQLLSQTNTKHVESLRAEKDKITGSVVLTDYKGIIFWESPPPSSLSATQ